MDTFDYGTLSYDDINRAARELVRAHPAYQRVYALALERAKAYDAEITDATKAAYEAANEAVDAVYAALFRLVTHSDAERAAAAAKN